MTNADKKNEFEFIQGLTEDISSSVLIFPTSLKATMNIRHAITCEDLSIDHLARIVSTEPVLSAQILKLSNSPAFNSTGKVNMELCTAVARLGFVNVRNLAISVGMKQLTAHKKMNSDITQLMEGLWNRSMRVAVFSYVIAKKMTRINPDSALLAGLLHDVGKFYILNRAQQYQSLFSSRQALWNVVDAWHSNIGAVILENWEVSDNIRNAVQNFGSPKSEHQCALDLGDMIVAADMLDAHFDASPKRKLNWNKLPSVLQFLALDAEKGEELRELAMTELDLLLTSINCVSN